MSRAMSPGGAGCRVFKYQLSLPRAARSGGVGVASNSSGLMLATRAYWGRRMAPSMVSRRVTKRSLPNGLAPRS